MAELNAHHEVPYEEHPSHEPSHTPERPEVVVVPLSPIFSSSFRTESINKAKETRSGFGFLSFRISD